MSKTYVIADLHGRFDLLEKAFSAIWKDYYSDGLKPSDDAWLKVAVEEAISGNTANRPTIAKDSPKIITLGDYVDRGPQSQRIIQHLMVAQAVGLNVICLKGNHEDMMVETLRKPLNPGWWIGNGGGQTLISYGHAKSGSYKPEVVPASHVDWLTKLPTMHIDKHRVYVHAGVDPTIALDDQIDSTVMWMRYPRAADLGHGHYHVVHGHEQYGDGPILHPNRTDLDTFAWATGRLVVGVFHDDTPGGPVDLIEVLADPAPGFDRTSLGY